VIVLAPSIVSMLSGFCRFNGLDQRLERTVEAACMAMEAFDGYKEKFKV